MTVPFTVHLFHKLWELSSDDNTPPSNNIFINAVPTHSNVEQVESSLNLHLYLHSMYAFCEHFHRTHENSPHNSPFGFASCGSHNFYSIKKFTLTFSLSLFDKNAPTPIPFIPFILSPQQCTHHSVAYAPRLKENIAITLTRPDPFLDNSSSTGSKIVKSQSPLWQNEGMDSPKYGRPSPGMWNGQILLLQHLHRCFIPGRFQSRFVRQDWHT